MLTKYLVFLFVCSTDIAGDEKFCQFPLQSFISPFPTLQIWRKLSISIDSSLQSLAFLNSFFYPVMTSVNYFLRIFIIVFQVPGGAGSDIWRWPGKTSNQVFIFDITWWPYNLIDQNIKNYHQNHHHYLSETVRTWLQWSILNAAWRNLSGFNLKKNFCNAELWCASLMCSF